MGVQPEGVEGANGKSPPRLRRGETLCNIKGTTAQFVGSAGECIFCHLLLAEISIYLQ